jgi:hypothetical protein
MSWGWGGGGGAYPLRMYGRWYQCWRAWSAASVGCGASGSGACGADQPGGGCGRPHSDSSAGHRFLLGRGCTHPCSVSVCAPVTASAQRRTDLGPTGCRAWARTWQAQVECVTVHYRRRKGDRPKRPVCRGPTRTHAQHGRPHPPMGESTCLEVAASQPQPQRRRRRRRRQWLPLRSQLGLGHLRRPWRSWAGQTRAQRQRPPPSALHARAPSTSRP